MGEQKLRQLERANQREASRREECERRLKNLQADKHRHLSGAKDALQQAKEALAEVRDGMQRPSDSELKDAYRNCHEQLQELEQRLQQQQSHRGVGSSTDP